MSKKLTKEEILERFKEKYGEFYDYSKMDYKGVDYAITISCPFHGDFQKTPYNFLKGQECEYCKRFEEMKRKAVSKYGSKFDYSKAKKYYFDRYSKVQIKCFKHGEFNISFDEHLNKTLCGCPECGKEEGSRKKIKTTASHYTDDLKKKYGDKFDYSKVEYKGLTVPITIICKKCGKVMRRMPFSHLSCIDCSSKERAKTTEQFIEDAKKIHGDAFDYSLVNYINVKTQIKLICKKCGEVINKYPNELLAGKGCRNCKIYKGERKIKLWLEHNNITYTRNKDYSKLKDTNPLSYDFYLKDYNMLIEYNGIQHYEFKPYFHKTLHDFHKQLHHDWLKRKYALKNGYKLLTIPYWEINNIEKILSENLVVEK